MASVTIDSNRYTISEPLYQWDLNQVLTIYGLSLPTIPEIHFTNDAMDRAIVRQATMDNAGVISAEVPNSLLQKPYKIRAYVCIYEGNTFKSLYMITIPVEARNQPKDYTIADDEEIYSFNALENKIDNILAESLERYDEVNTKYEQTEERYSQACDTLDQTTKVVEDAVENAEIAREAAETALETANEAKETAETAKEMIETAITIDNTVIADSNNPVSGAAVAAYALPKDYIPTPTTDDTGKFLRADASGVYVLETVPNAEEAAF